jgi:hypothetical protein
MGTPTSELQYLSDLQIQQNNEKIV